MAAKNQILGPTSPTPTLSAAQKGPDSGEDPPVRATATEESPEPEDSDPTREPKRRRHCPKALDKVEELIARSDPNLSFSFSFDTKVTASGTEVTPKFGSFDLKTLVSEKNPICKKEKYDEEEPDREPCEISSSSTTTQV